MTVTVAIDYTSTVMTQSNSNENDVLTPQDIKVVESAYQRGDFVEARNSARTLLTSPTLKEKDKTRLQQILTAISADPFATLGFGVTVFLMLFISIKYLL